MLTFDDLCAMCDLTEEEIEAIAAHEGVSMVIAAEIGESLLRDEAGRVRIYRMICDDIREAERRGRTARLGRYRIALRQFCREHPECAGRSPPG